MARIKTLALAIVIFTLANLLPLRAQSGVTIQSFVISNVMSGIDPACSTCIWAIQVFATNLGSGEHGTRITIADSLGNWGDVLFSGPNGNGEGGQMIVYNIPVGTTSLTVIQGKPGVVAVPMQLTYEAETGTNGLPLVVVSAELKETDVNGNVIKSSEIVDPRTISMVAGTAFAFPVGQIGGGSSDVVFSLSNPSSAPITVSITANPGVVPSLLGGNQPPSVQQVIPSGMSTWSVGQLFGQSFAAFIAQITPIGSVLSANQNAIWVTSSSPFAIAPTRLDGFGYIVQALANAFPLAPSPAPAQQ